ncbi:MAG TPA: L-aspartate oxidase, partial [Salinivirgaceae bacterium]|nr:L-aspartate oxidase [Salinivirgaceae bacterium]
MKRYYDFLIIGSGIAGLSYALKVAPFGKVAIVTKKTLLESNTRYAQGGIATVMQQPDNFEKHIEDTLKAGCYLNNREVVEMVVKEAPEQIEQLINWGIKFDTDNSGNFHLAKEGGHSERRILHFKDITGYEIEIGLINQVKQHPNIDVFENHFAIDIITQHHLGKSVIRYDTDIECYGCYVMDTKTHKIYTFLSPVTYLATGGSGNLYQNTTNPEIATGDGVAMFYRAKGHIENMEFVQFHPTGFYNSGIKPAFLLTEALRGFGAILRNIDQEEFMHKYSPQLELAPRDVVARAIDQEMKIHGSDFVYLDCRHLDKDELLKRFPNIAEHLAKYGIDITKDLIPVVPVAHYQCGGIKVDKNGCSSIHYLLAGGELASTGLHGANRLASNSLIEALVFANRSAQYAIQHFKEHSIPENIPNWNDEGTVL